MTGEARSGATVGSSDLLILGQSLPKWRFPPSKPPPQQSLGRRDGDADGAGEQHEVEHEIARFDEHPVSKWLFGKIYAAFCLYLKSAYSLDGLSLFSIRCIILT